MNINRHAKQITLHIHSAADYRNPMMPKTICSIWFFLVWW
jgi:hypothetical protein